MSSTIPAVEVAGLQLSQLGLGTATFGWLYESVSAAQATATVHRALELGIAYLDTAPAYGLGAAESKVGTALRNVDSGRLVVSTKVGRVLDPLPVGAAAAYPGAPRLQAVDAWTEDGVRRSLEDSLTRLGLDRVDIAYIHDPDDNETDVYDTAFPALARLREEGTVRAIGAGMNQSAMMARFVDRLDIDVVLLAGRYTLLEQSALDDLLPACLARETRVVIGGAFNSGLLAAPTEAAHYDYGPVPKDLLLRAQAIQRVCADHDVPITAAALQFPLAHPAVASVLAGMRTPEEVEQNVTAFDTNIPDALWDNLRSEGLLHPEAPTDRIV
ncbi:aldo/keto reductase [Kribbella sp. NBC_00709]|uniref:aldo/keto reductase n=1 Tax=Kribbella sp. NBC_00709 TaxID=2975972 RepID=UPI002E2B067F|nr:aldo/keto reductase [Kribbella sp. NBC_00709]